jgi:hypothetical protein
VETQEQVVVAGPPPIPRWLQGLEGGVALYDPAGTYKVVSHKTGEVVFESNPGPQTWALLCPCEEVLVGGRRGGGKSKCLIAWMATGDLSLPPDDPARASFLLDKTFRGLFLREEYQSMVEFVEEAVAFFKPLGGKATGGNSKPVVLDFDSGAKIHFNHLRDESSFEKYRGWNLTRIGAEELTQIETLRRYLKLRGSLRSVERVRGGKRFPPLRTQSMATTNPDGPGAPWVKDRFVEVRDRNGRLIPWNTPMRDTFTGNRRIFIPFGVEANPYLSEDTPAGRSYRANLLSQDEVTRKQWMEGDWNAGVGKFFKEYRPEGPIGQEEGDKFPWAKHIVKSAVLKPWLPRWGSSDTGYSHPSAAHKFCLNDDGRVHIYDELQVRHVGYFEQGALLAKWWRPELLALKQCGKDPSIVIHMGSDAFSKTDVTKTKAEQVEAGIKEVLGPYGALILKYNEEEREIMSRDPKRAKLLLQHRQQAVRGQVAIVLKPCYIDRIAAWGYFRDMLRFRPAVLDLQTDEKREEYLRAVLATEGEGAYELQAAALKKIKPEVLPKLQIWDVCVELDRCLRAAQHDTRADDDPSKPSKREDVLKFNADENGLNGDDALESARNGIVAFKELESTVPQEEWVADRMDTFQEQHAAAFGSEITDPTRLRMMQLVQNGLYAKNNQPSGGSMILPRAASQRHRSVN